MRNRSDSYCTTVEQWVALLAAAYLGNGDGVSGRGDCPELTTTGDNIGPA